jgi:hypothetical protein
LLELHAGAYSFRDQFAVLILDIAFDVAQPSFLLDDLGLGSLAQEYLCVLQE